MNIPIGIVGLLMVYLHLPDYREEQTHPLDIVGLILFGSGIALLSYVLEIFGEHTLSAREILGPIDHFARSARRLLIACEANCFPFAAVELYFAFAPSARR